MLCKNDGENYLLFCQITRGSSEKSNPVRMEMSVVFIFLCLWIIMILLLYSDLRRNTVTKVITVPGALSLWILPMFWVQ